MKSSKLINSFIINGVLAIICLCWTVPTFGLLISSFRDRIDINRTGWWTIFPHKDWVSVEKIKPGPEVDRNQPMTFEGITATFEELTKGIEANGLRIKWIGNRRVGYLDVQRYGWTAASIAKAFPAPFRSPCSSGVGKRMSCPKPFIRMSRFRSGNSLR